MSELPRGWVEATLGDVLEPRSEKADPSTVPDLPFLGLEDVEPYSGKVIGYGSTADMKSSVALFSNGDLLFGRLRPYLQKILIADCDGAASAEFIVMKTNQYSHLGFFSALLRSDKFLEYTALVSSGDRPRVSYESIADFNLALPPLAEQKRIVAKLDALNAKSARARTELVRIETLVSRYKQAVLSKAFSGELTAHLREPSIDVIQATISDPFTHTQSAPASWTRHLFSEVCTIVGGSQPPKTTFAYTLQEGYVRLVQIRDYKSDAKATYIPKALARRFCSSTDIMIGRYGPPIFQILRGIEGAYNVALMKAEPTEAVAQEFLYWYLHHPVLFKYVEIDSKRTAGQDGVNKAHLERWPILLPPLEEQHEIVRRIESAFAKIDRLAKEAKRALELVGRLDEAILAKAFRGELVPQDQNDEPAGLLLERIRQARTGEPSRPKRRAPATKIKVNDMARTIIEALGEAKDWLAAQELFALCGVRDGSSTEDVEKLYRQLLDLERQDRVEIEEVADPLTGAKLGNRVRLRK